jgi:uncharacterized membrane protein
MSTTMEFGTRTSDGETLLGTALVPEARPRQATTARYQRVADSNRGTGGEKLADFLGLFSLGLGLAELLAPQAIARLIGVKHPGSLHRTTLRLMGLREITSGVAILSNPQPTKSVWSRVVGDAIDLGFLGVTLANPENDRGRTLFAIANVSAVSALDVMCARQLASQPETPAHEAAQQGFVRVRRSITIGRPVEQVYAFWRDFENLPRFMTNLESVQVLDDDRTHWIAKGPAGRTVEWDAETLVDRENEQISWCSLPGADVFHFGTVEFQPAPAGRGTEVRVELEYYPPFGKLGSKIAMLWRKEPRQELADDLRHLKQVLELGEVVVSDANKQRGPHPAQPDGRPPRF